MMSWQQGPCIIHKSTPGLECTQRHAVVRNMRKQKTDADQSQSTDIGPLCPNDDASVYSIGISKDTTPKLEMKEKKNGVKSEKGQKNASISENKSSTQTLTKKLYTDVITENAPHTTACHRSQQEEAKGKRKSSQSHRYNNKASVYSTVTSKHTNTQTTTKNRKERKRNWWRNRRTKKCKYAQSRS